MHSRHSGLVDSPVGRLNDDGLKASGRSGQVKVPKGHMEAGRAVPRIAGMTLFGSACRFSLFVVFFVQI